MVRENPQRPDTTSEPAQPTTALTARPPAAIAAPLAFGGNDPCAVASAVLGLTAIVPVVSQVAGLAFGVASLVRIRRAARLGVVLRGRTWAIVGLASSSFALLCWLAIFVAFVALTATFRHAADALPAGAAHSF